MLKKSSLREIRDSLGRYLAILAIVMLGVGFFCGLKITKQAMIATTNKYLQEDNLYDFQLLSTLGFSDENVADIADYEEAQYAEGSVSRDALVHYEGETDDKVIKFHSITTDINTLTLTKGRMPKAPDECVIDHKLGEDKIGKEIDLSDSNDKDTLDMFKNRKLKVVGIITSPIYLNFERGTTSLGDGSVTGFAYLNRNGFDSKYYTEVYLKLKKNYTIYSDLYTDYIDDNTKAVEKLTEAAAEERHDDIVREATEKWEKNKKKYDDNYNEYLTKKADAEKELSDNFDKLKKNQKKIKSQQKKLLKQEKTLKSNKIKIKKGLTELEAAIGQMEMAGMDTSELTAKADALKANLAKVEKGLTAVERGKSQLKSAEKKIDKGFRSYRKAKAKAEKEFANSEKKLDEAKEKLDKGKDKISDIKKADTYVLDRNTNIGYACFESDASIVDGICKVFPLFFFLVAALVCMTTMTRMVDEQRTQIGVLKALGYSNASIVAKYLFYSGSASLIGAVTGIFAGSYIFPKVIWKAYGMMYDFNEDLLYIINPTLAGVTIVVALLCATSATIFSCYNEFREVPAQLIRPRAPKNGKRILLERISFIWSRLGFLYKVTFRNIFRYKKRFLMMVVGISGCTALLVAGLGIRDSIQNVVNFQFDEIQTYHYDITFKDDMSSRDQVDFYHRTKDNYKDIKFIHKGSADIIEKDKVKAITLIAAGSNNFGKFVDLHEKDGTKISYPKRGEAVICKKLANTYNISEGDYITLRNDSMKEDKVKVSGICQNYIYNYVYITPGTYKSMFGTQPEIKTAMVISSTDNGEEIHKASTEILDDKEVSRVSINDDMRNRVNNMMKSLNAVVLLVVISAGALAFIVLYNLTNINITERIREIATIKVLGFTRGETSSYVFRENLFLTGISSLVGLVLGRILLDFIISKINVDLISFDTRITVLSYILAVILTFVFAFIVNIAMSRKLEKISMTESLKSIE